ncbi:MAG: TonB-dependent receptor [Rhodocyclaceae bacterium]|nr:TonB-dependent receptor [Rhodocyclaceae bacterium]
MNRQNSPRQIVLAALMTLSLAPDIVLAQSAAQADPKKKIEEIVVVGNPLGVTDARDVVSPVSSLSGDELLMKRGNTLGETLNGMPGVSASWFGPNAGRPVIRGLDGDRVRVLTNLGSSFDASSLSFDHNPAIDPLIIERVEVLRGPAALLYGGTAIGGVVNVIDNRIPAAPIVGPRGAFEVRGGGADRERSVATLLEAGNGVVAIHADGFNRSTQDYRVPSSTQVRSPVVNSSASASGGALGASLQFMGGKGSAGVSHSNYQSNYGTVAEADVRIDMRQTRTAAEITMRDLGGALVDGAFIKASKSDYKHIEFEGSDAGTTFNNTGSDIRAEIKHAKFGPMQGVFGFQGEQFEFSALGEEAFIPKTKTNNRGVFLYEEIASGAMKYAFGARAERSRVEADAAANGAPVRFGSADSRSFTLASVSAGLTYRLSSQTSFSANVASNERAPTYYELFADGPHVATAAYEVGNRNIGKERATSIDLGLKWRDKVSAGATNVSIGVFMQSFSRFLVLRRTGVDRDAEGNRAVSDCGDNTSVESGCAAAILPEYRYQATSARLSGIEFQGGWRAMERAGWTWDIKTKLDYVRATDRTNNEPLPRIAPLRFGVGTVLARGGLRLAADIERAAKQGRIAPTELGGVVQGYSLISASVMYNLAIGAGKSATFFVRGANLGDQRAFNAASIDTIRYLAPLPGRSVKAGVRVDF